MAPYLRRCYQEEFVVRQASLPHLRFAAGVLASIFEKASVSWEWKRMTTRLRAQDEANPVRILGAAISKEAVSRVGKLGRLPAAATVVL